VPATDPEARSRTATIVILTFDPPAGTLENAVESVLAASPDVDVIVVDNGGRARERLDALFVTGGGAFADVEVVDVGRNGGYAAGMNIGLDLAFASGADAVALLNDDVVVSEGWLAPLLDELWSDDRIGAVQPVLCHGVEVDRDAVVNSAGVAIDRFGAGADLARDRPVAQLGTEPRDIEAFTGGAVVLRREFIDDVGHFDERFFLYYEDVELSRRGRRSTPPWRYRLVPASMVWHAGSATTAALGDEARRLQERNRLWSSAMDGSAGEIVRGLGLSLRRLRHHPRAIHRRALLDGVRGMPRRLAYRARRSTRGGAVVNRVRARRAASRLRGTPGVNVVGYHHISSGLGSNARELTAALAAAGIPHLAIDNDLSTSPRRRPARAVPEEVFDTTIAIVTAFEFPLFCERFPQLRGPGKRMIGFWVWELEDIPPQHVDAVALVDEIWTPTTFVQDAYRAAVAGRVPVRLAPFRMEEPEVDPGEVERWRSRWGTDVVFLVSFDYLSIVERKNPRGAITAFRRAFDRGDERVRLVVKSINGDQRPDDAAVLAAACGDDPRIEIVDEHFDDARHHALLAAADVLVSLHRSEGFGLHPAIAMWLGTPVIATRYSGVCDFLDDSCAALVDAELVAVTNGCGIYPDTARWADPDLDQAARHMRDLADDPHHRQELAIRGRRRIADQPSPAVFGEGYAAMLRVDPQSSVDAEPFFAGLDAARGRIGRRSSRRPAAVAWPDSARRSARSLTRRHQ
jgi:GT2 family glycosyltransferase